MNFVNWSVTNAWGEIVASGVCSPFSRIPLDEFNRWSKYGKCDLNVTPVNYASKYSTF